jgi:hypothetical protein
MKQSPSVGHASVELDLPETIRVHAKGKPAEIVTVKQAVTFVDRHVHPDLARLPRWTFARALLEEASRTGKSRDVNAAFRQLKQALSNEKWLSEPLS